MKVGDLVKFYTAFNQNSYAIITKTDSTNYRNYSSVVLLPGRRSMMEIYQLRFSLVEIDEIPEEILASLTTAELLQLVKRCRDAE